MTRFRLLALNICLFICSLASAQTFSIGGGMISGIPKDLYGYGLGIGIDLRYDRIIAGSGSWKLSVSPEILSGDIIFGVPGGVEYDNLFINAWLPALIKYDPAADKRHIVPYIGPYAELFFDRYRMCEPFNAGITLGASIPIKSLSLDLRFNAGLLNRKENIPPYFNRGIITASLTYPF